MPLPTPAARFWALVPCAGSGVRAGGDGPKQYRELAGRPLVMHTLGALAGVQRLAGGLVIVAPGDRFFTADAGAGTGAAAGAGAGYAVAPGFGAGFAPTVDAGSAVAAHPGVAAFLSEAGAHPAAISSDFPLPARAAAPASSSPPSTLPSVFAVVPRGGATRAETVAAGLQALVERGAAPHDWVLVHDAARCLVTAAQVDALIDACAADAVGGLLAQPLADTLKTSSEDGRVASTVDRRCKWLAQTPQMFRLATLSQALLHAGPQVTDESSAIEALGLHPRLVPGSAQNFKVTWPEDFALAEAVLAARMQGATVALFGGDRGLASALPPRTTF